MIYLVQKDRLFFMGCFPHGSGDKMGPIRHPLKLSCILMLTVPQDFSQQLLWKHIQAFQPELMHSLRSFVSVLQLSWYFKCLWDESIIESDESPKNILLLFIFDLFCLIFLIVLLKTIICFCWHLAKQIWLMLIDCLVSGWLCSEHENTIKVNWKSSESLLFF